MSNPEEQGSLELLAWVENVISPPQAQVNSILHSENGRKH